MRQIRHHVIALVIIGCCALSACGSGSKQAAAIEGDSTVAAAADDGSAADATQPASAGGSIDCAAVKAALAKIIINWQVVIGLSNTPSTEWATIPLGTLSEFGDQLTTVTAAVASDPDAAAALEFMSGANDIVVKGVGGDAAAQADLATYMGVDTGANFAKQQAIATAYQRAGCK